MRIDKEGIAMKKILGKILAFILFIVMACCALIVACSMNRDVAQGASVASATLHKYIEESKKTEEEAAGSSQNSSSTSTDPSKANDTVLAEVSDAAATVASYTVTATVEKHYSDYQGEWNSAGLEKDNSSEDSSEKPYVNEDLMLDSTDDTAYYTVTDDMSSFALPQRNVVELESSDEVLEALRNTSMGSLGEEYTFSSNYYPYFNMLNDKCKALYKQIYANALSLKAEFLPVKKAKSAEWNNALMSVSYDHPELFWLDTTMYTEYDYKGNVVKVQISFYDEFGDLDVAKEKFEAMTSYLLTGTEELSSAYDIEVFIHDELANKLTYNLDAPLNQSAYSAIVGDQTVCAGYARAFQYLMQKKGIPTFLVVGWGGGLISGSMHGWNMVQLDDGYYNVDVTWDDQDSVDYNYFNKSDQDFHRHIRMFNSSYLPACNGKKYAKEPVEKKQ